MKYQQGLASYDGEAVDVFALGVLLFLILGGQPPFVSSNDKHYEKMMRNPEAEIQRRHIQMDKGALELIVCMLNKDPEQRYTLD